MEHKVHTDHAHRHSEHCGHLRIVHGDHIDYLHDGHLHAEHDDHYDEHVIEVSAANPDSCAPIACLCGHDGCGHPLVPHGDHFDYTGEWTPASSAWRPLR